MLSNCLGNEWFSTQILQKMFFKVQIIVSLTKIHNRRLIQGEICKFRSYKNISSPHQKVSKSWYRNASWRLRITGLDDTHTKKQFLTILASVEQMFWEIAAKDSFLQDSGLFEFASSRSGEDKASEEGDQLSVFPQNRFGRLGTRRIGIGFVLILVLRWAVMVMVLVMLMIDWHWWRHFTTGCCCCRRCRCSCCCRCRKIEALWQFVTDDFDAFAGKESDLETSFAAPPDRLVRRWHINHRYHVTNLKQKCKPFWN